jgi:phosphoenolpyruvate carboxylase
MSSKEVLEKIIFDNKPYLLYEAQDNKKIEGLLIVNSKENKNNVNVISKHDLNFLLETIDILNFKLQKIDQGAKQVDSFVKSLGLAEGLNEEYLMLMEEVQNYL